MEATSRELNAPDLTRRPPRSLRCRLGGFAVLPRLLDKCRATLAGSQGDYDFNCPLDQQFLSFTGIDPEQLKAEVARGRSDGEILEWIRVHARHQRAPWEIEQWSRYQEERAPDLHTESFQYFQEMAANLSRQRGDVHSWAELLDLDDYCSFGGAA